MKSTQKALLYFVAVTLFTNAHASDPTPLINIFFLSPFLVAQTIFLLANNYFPRFGFGLSIVTSLPIGLGMLGFIVAAYQGSAPLEFLWFFIIAIPLNLLSYRISLRRLKNNEPNKTMEPTR